MKPNDYFALKFESERNMKRLMIFLLIIVSLAGAGYGAYAMGYLPAELTPLIAAPAAQDAKADA